MSSVKERKEHRILFKKRLLTATDALENYIYQFTNVQQTQKQRTPKFGCYASPDIPSLLSTKDSRSKARNSTDFEKNMVENLVQWVNDSYTKDLQRKIVPFGELSSSCSVDTNAIYSEENGKRDDKTSTVSDTQLSTLPSPGASVIFIPDLDSNIGSINTEVLLESFYEHSHQHQEKQSYPSWVEELTTPKHYPSWVDELDESQFSQHGTVSQNQRNHLSKSLSPSFFRQNPPLSPKPQSHISTSLQEPREISAKRERRAWDLESTDTDVLISESIYGETPVNMGGEFHTSLYHDRKIKQRQDSNVRKLAKENKRSLVREMSFAQAHFEEKQIQDNTNNRSNLDKSKKSNNETATSKHTFVEQHMKATGEFQDSRIIPDYRCPADQNRTAKEFFNGSSTLKLPTQTGSEPVSFDRKYLGNTDRIQRSHNISSNHCFVEKPSLVNRPKRKSDIRKTSTDSSNTGQLILSSPTGFQMTKRGKTKNVENSKSVRKSSKSRAPTVLQTANSAQISEGFHPRTRDRTPKCSASEQLQNIIDSAESHETPKWPINEHYLGEKVSKKNLTTQSKSETYHTLIANRKRKDSKTETYDNKTTTESSNNSYDGRIDSGSLSSERIDSRNSSPSRIESRNLSPRRIDSGNVSPQRVDHRGKSAPSLMRKSLSTYRKYPRGNMLAQNNVSSEDVFDAESLDTKTLVTTPPMPLFDASPSLTTESAESSAESEESGDTLIENLALRTSFQAADNEMQSLGTRYQELTSFPRQKKLRERSGSPLENTPTLSFKKNPGIITEFLEDCMRNNQENGSSVNEDSAVPPLTEEERSMTAASDLSSERPVETLKQMLFSVQRLTHSSEATSDRDYQDLSTQSKTFTEEILSDIISTASRNEGQDSLSRAYFHLARLKRLVAASKEVAEWE